MSVNIQGGDVPPPEVAAVTALMPDVQHLCGVYEDHPREQFGLTLPFVREGLENGEQCVYVVDDQPVAELREALASSGIDVEGALWSGGLRIWTRREWCSGGTLQPAEKAQELGRIIDDALHQGFQGVRFVAEMTWTRAPDIAADVVARWEAIVDTIITPEVPARVICVYNRTLLDPAVIRAGLATHEVAIIGEEPVPNPFYESPLILDGAGSTLDGPGAARQSDWMIDRLLALRRHTAPVQPVKAVSEIRQDFTSLVSHEIRNPLTTVVGFTTFLEQRWPELDAEVISETLRLISRDAGRLSEFVENLIVLSGTGDEPDTEPVAVGVVARGVVESFRRTRPARTITFELAPGLPAVQGHSGMIAQALRNLLSNADRYSDEDLPISVAIDSQGGMVNVRIVDQGGGPPVGVNDPAFEPPIVAPDANAHSSGIGLGLASSRRLAAAMSGTLTVEPRPDGSGTVATLSLPAASS